MDVRKKETRRCVRGNEGKISRWKLDKQQDTKWSGKLELQSGRFEKHLSDYKLVVDAVNPIKTFLIFNKANVDLNKVNPTDNSRYEFDKFVRLNLLLLQGTKRSASKGILKEGFRPPTGG